MATQSHTTARANQIPHTPRKLRISQRMGPPKQLFQLPTTQYAPTLQRNPMNMSPIRCRDNALSLHQLAKSLRSHSKRQHRPSILLKIKLGKHLPATRLRTYPKDKFVAPPPRLATGLDNVRQRQQKSACTLSIHVREYASQGSYTPHYPLADVMK
jgi:hypothetical protein